MKIQLMKHFILSFLLTITFVSFGQYQYKNLKYSIYKTDIDELKKTEILQCFKLGDDYIFFTKRAIVGPGGWFYSVEKYDQNFKEISRFNISDYASKHSLIVNNHIVLKDKLFLVFEEKKDEVGTGYLFYTFLDFTTYEIGPRFPFNENSEPTEYILKKSPDDNIIMVISWQSPNENSLQKKFSFNIVDRNFEEIISYQDFEINLEGDFDYLTSFHVDNEARIYWLQVMNSAKTLEQLFETNTNENSQKIELKQLEYSVLTSQSIVLPEKEINSLGIKLQQDNSLFIGGYYNNTDEKNIRGAFVMTNLFTKNGEPTLKLEAFGPEIGPPPAEEWNSQETRKYENLGLQHLSLEDVVILENGDVSLVGHMQQITYNYSGTANFSNNIYSSYFGDYIVTNFQTNGSVSHSKFENYQSMSPSSTYCKFFNIGDETIILKQMNGLEASKSDRDQLSKKEKKELKKKHAIYITSIDNTGQQTTNLFIDYSQADFLDVKNNRWLTKSIFFLPEVQEAILFCEFKDNKHGFIKFEFVSNK